MGNELIVTYLCLFGCIENDILWEKTLCLSTGLWEDYGMKLVSLRLKNFRAFKNVEMRNIPAFCVIVGANGTGKSTVFKVFEFLKDAMSGNVNTALARLGGSRGFSEVRSRGTEGPIEIEIKFRSFPTAPLATYLLRINERNGRAYVEQEILKYRRGSKGQPWRFIDFSEGKGMAVTNELSVLGDGEIDVEKLQREAQNLKSDDILAIKGLAQFERFPVVVHLGGLIENWHISDFHISRARPEQDAGYAEHLSREGENLSLVVEYLYKNHRKIFDKILNALGARVPGVVSVEAKTTDEGRVLLKFKDGAFEDPFLARHVSDGTIKMLAYLVLLNDPSPHPLLCVEEPENQLYPGLLQELAEEFRDYAQREDGGQVMVSTHSPDFLNAVDPSEVFILYKEKGYTVIRRAADDPQVVGFVQAGDKMGWLWKQKLLGEIDPK